MNTFSDTLDQYALAWIKMYYWPFFLAGNMDNIRHITRIYNPMYVKLGNICNPNK